MGPEGRIPTCLASLYGEGRVAELLPPLEAILALHRRERPVGRPPPPPLSERDVLLISYPDQVVEAKRRPLRTLASVLSGELKRMFSGLHLLPFFPSSSDDGFSIVDYRQVDPGLGTWEDVRQIAGEHRLMIDAVINHVSAQSAWFQAFLKDDPRHRESFISLDPAADLSTVTRPREHPLLTPFETTAGRRHVWTTFSPDQVDLNFANPQVLLEILDLLLFYVRHGAQLLRLDAIAYLWKAVGTASIHLPQTHRVVQLIRAVLEAAEPGVLLVTETNVPDAENRSYFGRGDDEAHLVYQFSLPPLVLHALLTGDASRLTDWAAELRLPGKQATYLNFLASHDGIGLRPAASILPPEEITLLIERAESNGGGVSYRSTSAGGRAPYELNTTDFDGMTEPGELAREPGRAVARFLAAQAVMLALAGVPAVYFHSLLGSRNDLAGFRQTGRLRSLNRAKLSLDELRKALTVPGDPRAQVFAGYSQLLRVRTRHPAFSPWAAQQILDLGPSRFALIRESEAAGRVICLHEISGSAQVLDVPLVQDGGLDLLADQPMDGPRLHLQPYQVRWIAIEGERAR